MNRAEQAALLDAWSVLNDVMTEHDALSDDKLRYGMGRMFRAWKRTRDVLAAQSYAPLRSRIPERSERDSQNT